ncbi:hypothetical protein QBC38DRAFT_106849, partial [Podospora fimiseda]
LSLYLSSSKTSFSRSSLSNCYLNHGDHEGSVSAVAHANRDTYTPAVIAQVRPLALDPTYSEKVALASLLPLDPANYPRFIVTAEDFPDLPTMINTHKPQLAYPGTVSNVNRKWYGTVIKTINRDSFDCALRLPHTIFNLGDIREKVAAHVEPKMLRRLKRCCSRPGKLNAMAGRIAVLNLERNPGGG